MMNEIVRTDIHFHSGDERFCGSDEIGRRFTLEPNGVTCERCKDRDRFVLSESGAELLAELGYAGERRAFNSNTNN